MTEHVVTEHVEEELVPLLSGELDPTGTGAVRDHLRACGACRDQLVDSAVVHGTLRAVARVEGELRLPSEPGLDPVGSVGHGGGVEEQPPLRFPARAQHRDRRRATVTAAAAVLVLAVAGWGVARHSGRAPVTPVAAVASLRHLDAPASARGAVTVRAAGTTRQMEITTGGLAQAPANHYYEVWLLQPTTDKMLPVGVLPPSGSGAYELSAAVMAQYSAIDVSLQANDGNPAHSAQSVLRGSVRSV
jgi:hypothetical protein